MQKLFHISILLVYLHSFIVYLYWRRLSSNPAKMHHLNMFFIADLNEFCRYYNLNRELARKFQRKTKNYQVVMYILLSGFTITFYALIIRCLVVSYTSIPLVYFLLIACPMALIDLFGFIWLFISFLVNLLMAVLTMEFLILRATDVSNNLTREASH